MLSGQQRSLIGAIAFIVGLALVGYMGVGFAGALFSVAFVGGLVLLPGKGMALLPSPSPKNRACCRVGCQRVTQLSTFPTAPLQTARESFDLKSALQ